MPIAKGEEGVEGERTHGVRDGRELLSADRMGWQFGGVKVAEEPSE